MAPLPDYDASILSLSILKSLFSSLPSVYFVLPQVPVTCNTPAGALKEYVRSPAGWFVLILCKWVPLCNSMFRNQYIAIQQIFPKVPQLVASKVEFSTTESLRVSFLFCFYGYDFEKLHILRLDSSLSSPCRAPYLNNISIHHLHLQTLYAGREK